MADLQGGAGSTPTANFNPVDTATDDVHITIASTQQAITNANILVDPCSRSSSGLFDHLSSNPPSLGTTNPPLYTIDDEEDNDQNETTQNNKSLNNFPTDLDVDTRLLANLHDLTRASASASASTSTSTTPTLPTSGLTSFPFTDVDSPATYADETLSDYSMYDDLFDHDNATVGSVANVGSGQAQQVPPILTSKNPERNDSQQQFSDTDFGMTLEMQLNSPFNSYRWWTAMGNNATMDTEPNLLNNNSVDNKQYYNHQPHLQHSQQTQPFPSQMNDYENQDLYGTNNGSSGHPACYRNDRNSGHVAPLMLPVPLMMHAPNANYRVGNYHVHPPGSSISDSAAGCQRYRYTPYSATSNCNMGYNVVCGCDLNQTLNSNFDHLSRSNSSLQRQHTLTSNEGTSMFDTSGCAYDVDATGCDVDFRINSNRMTSTFNQINTSSSICTGLPVYSIAGMKSTKSSGAVNTSVTSTIPSMINHQSTQQSQHVGNAFLVSSETTISTETSTTTAFSGSSPNDQRLTVATTDSDSSNIVINSIMERLESANSLLDLSQQANNKTNTSVPCTSGQFLVSSINSVTNGSVLCPAPAPIYTTTTTSGCSSGQLTSTGMVGAHSGQLPTFTSTFGYGFIRCADNTKKRKSNTVREMLDAKSCRQKMYALMHPTPTQTPAVDLSSVPSPSLMIPAAAANVGHRLRFPQCSTTIGQSSVSMYDEMTRRSISKNVQSESYGAIIRQPSIQQNGRIEALTIPIVFVEKAAVHHTAHAAMLAGMTTDRPIMTNWQIRFESPHVCSSMNIGDHERNSLVNVNRTIEPQQQSQPLQQKQHQHHQQQQQQHKPPSEFVPIRPLIGRFPSSFTDRSPLLREALLSGDNSDNQSQTKSSSCILSLLKNSANKKQAPESLQRRVELHQPPTKSLPATDKDSSALNATNKKESSSHYSFRSQQYEMDLLTIGTYQSPNQFNQIPNKFKVMFSKKRLVYEFMVTNLTHSDHDPAIPHLTTIEVPFDIINAVHCNGLIILVSVTQAPHLYLYCRPQFGRSVGARSRDCSCPNVGRGRPTDITGGQLRINHLHKIYLRNCSTDSLKAALERFDPRFTIILQTPILEVVQVDYSAGGKPVSGNSDGPRKDAQNSHCVIDVLKPPQRKSDNKQVAQVCVLCHCQVSCRSNRCSCMKARMKCGLGSTNCFCKDCDNPLNVLDSLGFRAEDCAADICLIHNIVTYKGDLYSYLERTLKFPCCGHQVRVKNCIPGTVRCPNVKCMTESCGPFKFSWCDGALLDEKERPRNHCSLCRSCQGCIDLHCSVCRRCNPLKISGSKCPECRAPRDTTYTEIRDIATVMLLLDRQDKRPSPIGRTRITRQVHVQSTITLSADEMSLSPAVSTGTLNENQGNIDSLTGKSIAIEETTIGGEIFEDSESLMNNFEKSTAADITGGRRQVDNVVTSSTEEISPRSINEPASN